MKGSRRPPLSPPLGVVAIAVMMLTAVVTMAVVVVALAGPPAPPAAAQGDGITIADSGVANRFPDGLHFHIDAASAGSPIKEIRVYVYVHKLGQTSRSDYRTSAYRTMELEPEPEKGLAVAGEFLLKSRTGNEYIPPGARLSYHFEIHTDDTDDTDDEPAYTTEPETIVYLNRGLDWQCGYRSTNSDSKATSEPEDRVEWQSVSSDFCRGRINVYYYPLGNDHAAAKNRAKDVLEVASDTYDLMQPILGVDLKEPMNIVVYSDYDDMRAGLRPSSRVAAQHLRTLGQAFSSYRALLVDGSSDFFIGDNTLTTAAHEFTHLLVADAAESTHTTAVHTWLNEGLAVYSERAAHLGQNEDSEFGFYLEQAIRSDAVPPLTALQNFTGTPQETLLYYGMGHSVVSHMLETYEDEQMPVKMPALFRSIRELRNTKKALVATYGLTIHELDNKWRSSVGLAERAVTTPPPPPLQVIPTRKPTPTPTAAIAPADVAGATATPTPTGVAPPNTPAPTYTPYPTPTRASTISAVANGAEDAGLPPGPPASGGGCAAPLPASESEVAGVAELAAAGLLAGPVGLLALVAWRRRRPN